MANTSLLGLSNNNLMGQESHYQPHNNMMDNSLLGLDGGNMGAMHPQEHDMNRSILGALDGNNMIQPEVHAVDTSLMDLNAAIESS